MKNIIVYDFDKTIYKKETSLSFLFFYIKKHPLSIFLILKSLIKISFLFNKFSLKNVKNIFFEFIKNNKNIDKDIKDFWQSQDKFFFPYFFEEIKENKKEADYLVLISASPDFLLNKIYKKLGFDVLISTRYDKNYHIIGENCKGVEKVNRLNEVFKEYKMLSFYSDSLSDLPLYDLSINKFYINKNGEKHKGIPKKNGLVDKWK
ncbi:HAD-IB family phosphatase [Oceanivirga miroungae]|uniref:HAD-superfamily hydrolase n=1 Tax=Oceanivirga miroungae TaxID=1130046 RepID=A0A6I8M6D1_9FUSO|nr:HAD-IB family phosphatase [Oceanivirga miroungae]VWL84921.1 HAD-superfamily hydrolase [Oceanivirga miroungae]